MDGCNPTKEKKKKKKKGKKVTVEVKCESFFNIFTTLDPDAENADGKEPQEKDDKKDKKKKGGDDDDEDDEEDDMETKLGDAVEVGDQIKDDLVPLALEYYLGVIEIEDADMDDDDEGDDDSDEDKPKPKKKPGKKGDPANQKECK